MADSTKMDSPNPELHRSLAEEEPQAEQQDQEALPFAPIYTLVHDTSSRTTHHPQVHYIFSDDDPELLTHALEQQRHGGLSSSRSATEINDRAIILDLA
jgi:hypothetical protein